MTLAELVDDYFAHLTLAGRAERTVSHYHAYIRDFIDFAERRGVALEDGATRIDRPLIVAYQMDLAERRTADGPLTLATRNLYASALRGLIRHGVTHCDQALPAPDTVVLAKIGDRQTRHMERSDFDRLIAALPSGSPTRLRDRALLEVLFATGCRLSELCALTRRRVDLRTREVEVLGKGKKVRGTYLTAEAAEWLARYLNTRRDESPHLFVSRRAVRRVVDPATRERVPVKGVYPVAPRSVQALVTTLARRAGLPDDFSPHWFRHGRLTIVARHAGLLAAQELAGHASPQTTRRYTKITSAELRRHFDDAERLERGGPPAAP
ncbi:MAG: tyrosine-type recombinase/integrase [Chloroflexota bacterium]|nr:tyrosine-type recombinase/integrase [Chloroflexota bacterium]